MGETTETEVFILCVPVTGRAEGIVPGSSQAECSQCHQAVWLSQETADRPDAQYAKLVCPDCVGGVFEETDVVRMQPLTVAEIEAVVKTIRRDAAQRN